MQRVMVGRTRCCFDVVWELSSGGWVYEEQTRHVGDLGPVYFQDWYIGYWILNFNYKNGKSYEQFWPVSLMWNQVWKILIQADVHWHIIKLSMNSNGTYYFNPSFHDITFWTKAGNYYDLSSSTYRFEAKREGLLHGSRISIPFSKGHLITVAYLHVAV